MEQVPPKGNSRMLVNNGFASCLCSGQCRQSLTWQGALGPAPCTPQKSAPDHAEATTVPGFPDITGLLSTLPGSCKQIKEEFGGLMTLEFAGVFPLFILILLLAR